MIRPDVEDMVFRRAAEHGFDRANAMYAIRRDGGERDVCRDRAPDHGYGYI